MSETTPNSPLPAPHPLTNQEILFTRQRHEADRMGLHWDYRMVLGDKAYSWATKKEMPEPGKAILLFEQPIHDRDYALSEKVVIPTGQYGGGTTYLDFVQKAKVEDGTEEGKLVINTKDGGRFLLKKLDEVKYGKGKPWLFKNLAKYNEGPDSTFTHDGKDFKVDDAILLGGKSKTVQIPVSELDWALEGAQVDPSRVEIAQTHRPVLVTDWRGKKVIIDGTHRLFKAKSQGKEFVPTKYVDTTKLNEVKSNRYLEKISSDKFSPDLTPDQMKVLGVLRHKGSQYGEGGDKDNFFGIRASQDTWPEKWHNEEHPQGWYQWYQNYAAGKRTSDDDRQMKRWVSFKARHLAQLQKADPTLSDLSIQPKRRQALLNWGIAPGINVEKEIKNKYLEKIAMDPISMGVAHALGAHLVQNVGMKLSLKTKALSTHIAKGFHQGLAGVVDTSVKAKATRFLSGALLPEVDALHRSAHALGGKLSSHLSSMSLREKAHLRKALISGDSSSLVNHPKVQSAMSVITAHSGGSDIKSLTRNVASHEASPFVKRVAHQVSKESVPVGSQFKPGVLRSKLPVIGGLVGSIVDPISGGLNTAKNLAQSSTFKSTGLGHRISEKLEHIFIKAPIKKGVNKGDMGKTRSLINDLTMGPVNTELRHLGSTFRD